MEGAVKFKKSNRQFRKKTQSEDNEDEIKEQPENGTTNENTDQMEEDTPVVIRNKTGSKKSSILSASTKPSSTQNDSKPSNQKTQKSLLSFDEVYVSPKRFLMDHQEEFGANEAVTKNVTKKEKKKKKTFGADQEAAKASSQASVSSYQSSTFGLYTPEYLEQLKKNSIMLGGYSIKQCVLISDRSSSKQSTETAPPKETAKQTTKAPPPPEAQPTQATPVEEEQILNAEDLEKMDLQQEEDDEEIKRWEEEQMRKGGAKPAVSALTDPSRKKAIRTFKLPLQSTSQPRVSVEDIQKRLKATLENLETVHKQHSNSLVRIDQELQTTLTQLEKFEKERSDSAAEHAFYKDLREYITDLLDCLAEKAPIVEDLEDELFNLESEFAEQVKRNLAPPVNTTVVNISAPQQSELLWVQEDMDPFKNPDFMNSRDNILSKAEAVFADTFEEFTSVKVIRHKFELWKLSHGETYKQTYCAHSMPMLFAPFVRLELLLDWNVLGNNNYPTAIEHMKWFEELKHYGANSVRELYRIPLPSKRCELIRAQDNKFEDDDIDEFLVKNLLAKILVPRAVKYVKSVWNPRLENQSQNLLNFVQFIKRHIESDADPIKELYLQISIAIQHVVESLGLKDEASIQNTLTVWDHKFNGSLLCQLMKNVSLFEGVLTSESLQRLLLDDLLNMRITPFLLQCKSKDKVMDTLQLISLPKSWTQENSKLRTSRLMLFFNFINNFTKRLETEKDVNLIKKMVKLLQNFGDNTTAQQLASRHQIQL